MNSLDFLNSLPLAAQISVGVFGGWLLIEAVRLPVRYFEKLTFRRCEMTVGVSLFLALAVVCGISWYLSTDTETQRAALLYLACSVFTVYALMWLETRSERLLNSGYAVIARPSVRTLAKTSPSPETIPTADAATSLDDDWADIAQQVEGENLNAPTVTETKPMRVGESREALAAYLGIPNDNPEGGKK